MLLYPDPVAPPCELISKSLWGNPYTESCFHSLISLSDHINCQTMCWPEIILSNVLTPACFQPASSTVTTTNWKHWNEYIVYAAWLYRTIFGMLNWRKNRNTNQRYLKENQEIPLYLWVQNLSGGDKPFEGKNDRCPVHKINEINKDTWIQFLVYFNVRYRNKWKNK